MMVPASVQRDVEFRIQEGINLATKAFGRNFNFPTISYNLSGKVAGTATYGKDRMRLNATLLMENQADFIARTVPHELAHLIAWEVYKDDRDFWNGRRCNHHGSQWKHVCRVIGMEDITRCHSYDVSSTARKSSQFVWSCECGSMMSVSRAKHYKMLGGLYTHKCGGRRRGKISFVVGVDGATKQEAVQQVRDGLAQSVEVKPVEVKPVEVKKAAPIGIRPGSGQSNLGQCRLYAIANPGVTSSTLRNWAEMSLGVSPHSARGIWSKLKKEGLVG